MENSRLSIRNSQVYHLHIFNSAEINIDAIDSSINITLGSSKTSPVFRYYRTGNKAHVKTTSIEYITLGYEFVCISEDSPDLNTEKLGLTGVKNEVYIYEPCVFKDGESFLSLQLRFRANSGNVNGLLFPKTILSYNIRKNLPIKISALEDFPYQNGETIYIEDKANNTFTFDINNYLPIVTNAKVKLPLHNAVFFIALNQCPSVTLTCQEAFDGNCRITFFNDYVEVESMGRKTRVSNCTFSILDSSTTYVHLRLDSSCTVLPSDRFANNDNTGSRKYIIDDSWKRDVKGTIKLGGSTVYVFCDQNKYPQGPSCFVAGGSITFGNINNVNAKYRTVPDLLPDPPVVCISNDDGSRSCGSDLDELLKEQKEAKVSILSSQTISGDALNDKPVEIDSANNANKVTIKVNEKLSSPSFSASNAKLLFDSEKPIVLNAKQISLKNIPEITSNQPLTIESEEIVIDANLLQNMDQWQGSIKNKVGAPKVTEDMISFDISKSEEADVDFSDTVSIIEGTSKFGVSEPEDREIRVKIGSKVVVNYTMRIADASMSRIIEAREDSTIKFEGYVFDTQIESKNGYAKVFASEGTVIGTPGSTLECGFGTIAQMSNSMQYSYRVNSGLEGNIIEVLIKNGTIVFSNGETSVEVLMRNIVLYATTNVFIKASADADKNALQYIVGQGGSVTIEESAANNVEEIGVAESSNKESLVEESSNGESSNEENSGSNNNNNSEERPPEKPNAGMIVGIVIAVLAVIGIVAGVALFLIRKKESIVNDEIDAETDAEADAEI